MAEFEKKRITDHHFPPPLKMWGRKIITCENITTDPTESQEESVD